MRLTYQFETVLILTINIPNMSYVFLAFSMTPELFTHVRFSCVPCWSSFLSERVPVESTCDGCSRTRRRKSISRLLPERISGYWRWLKYCDWYPKRKGGHCLLSHISLKAVWNFFFPPMTRRSALCLSFMCEMYVLLTFEIIVSI